MIQGFSMLSVNELALEIFDNLAELAEEFNAAYHELDNGARIVDCGVSTRGGYAAGRAFTEICMGGLGEVNFRMGHIREFPMPFIDVNTDFPSISCLGAQKAGWTVKVGNYFAMGSGPARALSLKPKHTYEVIDYEDDYDCAVMCLESDHLPNGEVMEKIAEECHIDVANVCAVVAPTSSIVGSIQVSGRCVETAIYKLNELGFDTRKIISAMGTAPVPPVRGAKLAMGVTKRCHHLPRADHSYDESPGDQGLSRKDPQQQVKGLRQAVQRYIQGSRIRLLQDRHLALLTGRSDHQRALGRCGVSCWCGQC